MTDRWIGSDQPIEFAGLFDEIAGDYLNDATVQLVMTDANGVQVAGQTWPLTLDYVPSSDGVYRALLEDGQVLTEGALYWFEVTVDAGSDVIYFWRWRETARYRSPSD